MRIEYRDLCIRNAENEDAEILARWWNDGRVMAHAGFPNGLNTSAEKIRDSIRTDTDDTRRRLIIEKGENRIGEMSYRNIGGQRVEIGIKICESDYQEKGLGRNLLSMLIRALFDKGFQEIVLDTNLNNTRAQHVYELLGFQKTGVRMNSWTDQLGNLQSAVDYALTEDKFLDYRK
ncbi:MAG: GNAT family N-acetyltransferase [Clostridia bacterium]|nr:GNAT family N-acetyltransferase [Clostridia bacterium]